MAVDVARLEDHFLCELAWAAQRTIVWLENKIRRVIGEWENIPVCFLVKSEFHVKICTVIYTFFDVPWTNKQSDVYSFGDLSISC